MELKNKNIDFSNVELKKDDTDYVIYHGGCSDGFGSAYSVWKYMELTQNEHKDDVVYYPAKHGASPPDVTGKNVVICDFSYDYGTLCQMIDKANSLVVLDHHKSAEKELENISEKNKVFRMDHSGAVITWKFFHETPVPKFILYIEDRDIWKKEMEYTDEFCMVFYPLSMKFEVYDEYIDEANVNLLIEKGKILIEHNNNLIQNICKYATIKFIEAKGKFYMAAIVQSNVLKSDIGNYLIKTTLPNCDFSIVHSYDDINNMTRFSLRSDDTKEDVSIIAKVFGGGGHRNASGATSNGMQSCLPCSVHDHTRKTYNIIQNAVKCKCILDNIEYDAVYINCAINKSKIGRYLLQKRYADCDFCVVWNYDQKQNITCYTIVFNNDKEINKNSICAALNGVLYGKLLICQKPGIVVTLS